MGLAARLHHMAFDRIWSYIDGAEKLEIECINLGSNVR
jgi:hypothetical protein